MHHERAGPWVNPRAADIIVAGLAGPPDVGAVRGARAGRVRTGSARVSARDGTRRAVGRSRVAGSAMRELARSH